MDIIGKGYPKLIKQCSSQKAVLFGPIESLARKKRITELVELGVSAVHFT